MNFFNLAEKKEQSKRHLNYVYSICTTTFNRDETLFKKLHFTVENFTSVEVFDLVFNKEDYLNKFQKDILLYLKSKYEISDEIFTEVIGIHELGFEIRSPQNYSKNENFVLLVHMIAISLYSGFTVVQQSSINTISKLILTHVQLQYLVDIIYKELSSINSFDNFQNYEMKFLNELEMKFNISL